MSVKTRKNINVLSYKRCVLNELHYRMFMCGNSEDNYSLTKSFMELISALEEDIA